MDFITSQIAIGDFLDPECFEEQYDAILNVAEEVPLRRDRPGLHLRVRDGEPITDLALEQAFRFLDTQLSLNRKVLVHCGGGSSRSVAIVCGYLSLKTGRAPLDVLRSIKDIRQRANPEKNLFISVQQYVEMRSRGTSENGNDNCND